MPTPPTATRNQEFCWIPAAVISKRIQKRAKSPRTARVVFEVDTLILVCPDERSSNRGIQRCQWLQWHADFHYLLRRQLSCWSLVGGVCRPIFPFSIEEGLRLTQRAMPQAVIIRILQSPKIPHGIAAIPNCKTATKQLVHKGPGLIRPSDIRSWVALYIESQWGQPVLACMVQVHIAHEL